MNDAPSSVPFTTPLLKSIAAAWNTAGVHYGVVHGLEKYPESYGRDIDVLVAEPDGRLVIELTRRVIQEQGWTCSVYPSKLGVMQIFGLRKENGQWHSQEIDLLLQLRLQWGPVCLVHPWKIRDEVYLMDDFYVHPWASFAKRILIQALAGNWRRLESRPYEFKISEKDRPYVEKGLTVFFGPDGAAEVIGIVENQQVDALRARMPRLKKKLFLHACMPQRWLRTFETCLRWVHGEWVAKVTPRRAAPVVAVVGPDGVGKSSTLHALKEVIQRDLPFPKVIPEHWRPNVLPRLGAFVGKPKPQADADGLLPPRRKAGSFGLIRKLYYFADFLIGYSIVNRIRSSNLFLTLYDRCFLDMMVDPLRFGLRDSSLLSGLYRWMPHPDLVVLLRDDPARIHARKPELPVEEIAVHLEKWTTLQDKGWVHCSIEIAGSPAEVAASIQDHVVAAFQKVVARSEPPCQ